MTETHTQLELQRLEAQLDIMSRRWEREADISRAAESLYRIIQATGTTSFTEPVLDALANLGDAIRASQDIEGPGR